MSKNSEVLAITSDDFDSITNKWGENADIDTADASVGQVVWPVKAGTQPYLFIDSPIQLQIRSSSADDTALGDGAQSVLIVYQDDGGIEKTVILETDGVSFVDMPRLSYGAFRMEVQTTGADNINVGNITLENGGSTYAIIAAGEGQTQIAVQRCPNNKTGIVRYHKATYARAAPSTNEAVCRLKIRKPDGTVVSKWDPTITTANPIDEKNYEIGGLTLNPGEWVYWEVISVSANNTPVRGSFDIGFNVL